MHYLYIIKSEKNGHLYIGQTADLRRRLSEHNQGLSISTKAFVPYYLVYYEAYRSQSDALRRERQLKRFKQGYTRLKERIVDSLREQS